MSKDIFASDHHFGHANIIKFCHRPFASVSDMNSKMVENWNSVVSPKDRVYYLGDMFYKCADEEVKVILKPLNYKELHFIWGKHDRTIRRIMPNFSSYDEIKNVKISDKDGPGSKRFVTLCHYAMRVWDRYQHGAWHLYGHSHSTLPELGNNSMDVGVDAVAKRLGNKPEDYRPVTYEEIKQWIK